MEYPFKDLLPLDEVLEREGYYNDWTHLDPEVFYSLTQISEYIKTKGFGVDVRLLIAQLAEHFSLKTAQINQIELFFKDVMQELAEDKDFYSLPEIAGARGGFDTLGKRLDNETFDMSRMGQDVKEAITGGSVAVVGENAVLENNIVDGQVTERKTSFARKSKNLHNTETTKANTTLDSNGEEIPSLEYALSDFIPVEGSESYVSNFKVAVQKYNGNKDKLGNLAANNTSHTMTSLTRFVRIRMDNSEVDNLQFEKGEISTPFESYGVVIDNLALPDVSLKDGSVKAKHIENKTITPDKLSFVEKSRNLYNAETTKVDTTVDGDALEIPSLEYALSDFIPVEGSESYVSNFKVAVQKYNGNKDKLGNLAANNTSHTMTSLTRFVRIRMDNSEVDNLQFEKGEISTPFQPYGGINIPNLSVQNKLIPGDNIIIDGDTISAEVPEIDLQPVYNSINATSENATQALTVANQAQDKADNVQTQISTLVIEGDSSAESAQSRVDKSGYTYSTLKERMDAEQISINLAARGLSPSNSASTNTAILQQAVIDAESMRGTLILPDVPSGLWIEIDDAILIESGHIKILGSMQNSRIKQTVYPKAIFDINAPYVTVDGMFGSGAEFTAHNSGTYRGHMEKSYYTTVAVYANDVHVKNIKADNLINGVFFYGWDTVNNVNKNIVNNSIENLEVSNVDFGFSASYVTDFNFHNVRGSHRQMPGSGTPPHLVYVVGSTPGINKNVTGSMLRPHDGNDAHAIKISGTKNGNITDIVSERSFGTIWSQDNEDVTFDGVQITDEKFDLSTQSVIEFWKNNTRVEVKNANVEIPINAKAIRLPKEGIDIKLTNIRIVTNYTEETQTLSTPVDIQGTGTILENITVENLGTSEWLSSIHVFEAFDTTIINPKTSGNKNGIYFRSGDGLLLRYYTGALGSQENYVVQSGASGLKLSTAE